MRFRNTLMVTLVACTLLTLTASPVMAACSPSCHRDQTCTAAQYEMATSSACYDLYTANQSCTSSSWYVGYMCPEGCMIESTDQQCCNQNQNAYNQDEASAWTLHCYWQ